MVAVLRKGAFPNKSPFGRCRRLLTHSLAVDEWDFQRKCSVFIIIQSRSLEMSRKAKRVVFCDAKKNQVQLVSNRSFVLISMRQTVLLSSLFISIYSLSLLCSSLSFRLLFTSLFSRTLKSLAALCRQFAVKTTLPRSPARQRVKI